MAKKGFSILETFNPQSIPDEEVAVPFAVEMIPLEEIEPNEDNFYSVENIQDLADDIRTNGLMHNIVVCGAGDGKYKLVSGERRYRAFSLLNEQGVEGYGAIPAMVDAEENPLKVRLKLISANASARVLSDYEKAEQVAQIEGIVKQLKQEGVDLPGRAREITAQVLGVSTAQAGRLAKISRDLVPDVKEKFAAGDIGVTEAYEVATLPPEQQVQAVEARAEKPSESQPEFIKKKLNLPEEKTPQIGETNARLVQLPWTHGFDDELLVAAIRLEDWNDMSCQPAEYKLIKSLLIQEAAMRKRRAE